MATKGYMAGDGGARLAAGKRAALKTGLGRLAVRAGFSAAVNHAAARLRGVAKAGERPELSLRDSVRFGLDATRPSRRGDASRRVARSACLELISGERASANEP